MLSENAQTLARKLSDAGPTEEEALAWVAEVIAEAVAEELRAAANQYDICGWKVIDVEKWLQERADNLVPYFGSSDQEAVSNDKFKQLTKEKK